MRKLHLRKYCYLVLWAALLAAVAGVWLFGGERAVKESGQASSSAVPSASPASQTGEAEEETLVGGVGSLFLPGHRGAHPGGL